MPPVNPAGGPSDDAGDNDLSAIIGAAFDAGNKPEIAAESTPAIETDPVDDPSTEEIDAAAEVPPGENADTPPDGQTQDGKATEDDRAKPAKDAAGKAKASTPELTPPKHWPKERADAFAKLPTPEAKKALLDLARDLEGGFTRKSQELADKVKFAESIRGVFTDEHRALMAQTRTSEADAVRYLVQVQDFSQKDPRGYLRWAMQILREHPLNVFPELAQGQPQASPGSTPQAGATTGAAAAKPSGETPATGLEDLFPPDPKVKALEERLAQQDAVLRELYGHTTSRIQAEQNWKYQQEQQRLAGLDRSITDFRGALDDAGQLKYPNFDALKTRMGGLMDTDPNLRQMPDGPEKMALAYSMAEMADPNFRQAVIDAQVAAKVAEQTKAQEAARAKRSSAIRPKTAVPVRTATKGRKLEDLIGDVIDQQGGLAS